MTEEKQIEELTHLIYVGRDYNLETEAIARSLYYSWHYRKQSENMVEVVRCKDCTHFQTVNGRAMCSFNAKKESNLWLGLRATVEDGFCHHGARMKGGEG